MKKLLALLLCVVMVISVFAGCTKAPAEPTDGSTAAPVETDPVETEPPTEPVEAEPVPEALYHWSFDDASNLTAVTQVEKAADSINDGAPYDIGAADHEIMIANGPVGNCLYLDGTYGVKLEGLESLADDSYTVSFWLNADRLATFGPVVQIGRNIGDAGDDRAVTWLNFTKAAWGTNGADLFPVAWNRNSSIGTDISEDGVWPWISAGDDLEHGKREWCLVTLVVSGDRYVCADDSMERIGAKYYLNGSLVFDASAENLFYQGVAPEILTGDGIEGYIGVNYWDTIYKGFIDELYIFDEALTDGQVLSLYQEGDPSVESVAPEAGADEPVITPDANAIDSIGNTALDMGFWTDWTSGTELADGASVTVKLNNYSSALANWNNFLVVLANVPTEGHTPPADQDAAYAEYAVIRADAFGWGDASYAAEFTCSWGDDWAGWLNLMKDAEVTLVLTRNGGEVTIDMTFVGADGTTMTETAVVTSTLTADAPCYFFFTGEACFVEVLSVE